MTGPVCLLPPTPGPVFAATAAAPAFVIEREQGDWLAEWVESTGSVRPRRLVPDPYWNQFVHQVKYVSPNVWWDLRKLGVATWLTYDDPITRLAHMRHFAGQTFTYPDGQTFNWDDLPEYGHPPTFRLDRLGWTTSAALVPHGIGHAADRYLCGDASRSPEWLFLHAAHVWWDEYTTTFSAEAWAESFAVYCSKTRPLAPQVLAYFDRLFRSRNWGPWLQGV